MSLENDRITCLTHMLCLIVEKIAPSQFEIAILPTFHKIAVFIEMAFFLEERKHCQFHRLLLEHLHARAYPTGNCNRPSLLFYTASDKSWVGA